jgi:serine/threonine-protein kinase HipA
MRGRHHLHPAGENLPERKYGYRPVSSQELAAIPKERPKRPLLAGEDGIRLSLAGAQDKVAVRIEGNDISLPLGGVPSTHILKPAVERFAGVVFNEALCMRLAATAGLPAAKVEARIVEDIEYLLVERYDRVHQKNAEGATTLDRLHQEYFCQAQGIASEAKYQKECGPSLKQCVALLRDVSNAPVIDLSRLLDAVIYNYLVGDNDAHNGKNFSLLYRGVGNGEPGDKARASLRCRQHHLLSRAQQRHGHENGGEYSSDKVGPNDFEQLAEEAGLAKPIVKNRVPELAETVIANFDRAGIEHPVAQAVAALIRKRCETVRTGFKK